MIEKLNQIMDFYKSKKFKPVLPSRSNWRQFKGIDVDGHWIVNKKTIRSIKALKEWIIKNNLIDVYYSKNEFLNPRKLEKPKSSISDHVLIKEHLVVDIDETFSVSGLNKARVQMKKCLEEFGYEIETLYFTGSKGFCVVFKSEKKDLDDFKEKVFILKKKGVSIDKQVVDSRTQIIRIIGTINSKSMLLCKEISEKDLDYDIDFKNFNPFNVKIPEMPSRWQMKRERESHPRPLKSCGSDRPGIRSSYISNRSGNRYVIFIERQQMNKSKIRKIQRTYDTGSFYGFRQGQDFYWISPRTFSFERACKILAAAGSSNLNVFKKYRRTIFKIDPLPTYVEKLHWYSASQMSKEHVDILSAFDEVDVVHYHNPQKLEVVSAIEK